MFKQDDAFPGGGRFVCGRGLHRDTHRSNLTCGLSVTQHAGLLFWEHEKGFGRRSVGVVALTTLLEHVRFVLVDTLKCLFLVAGEAAPLKLKPAAAAETVTMGAVDLDRRMCLKGSELSRCVSTHEEADLSFSSIVQQFQRMLAGRGLYGSMKNVGKGLLGVQNLSVQF